MSRVAGSSGSRWTGGMRSGLRLVAALLTLTLGCSSVRTVPIERVSAQGQGGTRVVMRDGYTYQFERVAVRGDSLYGSYVVTEERQGLAGEVIFEDVTRQTILPIKGIERLEVKHRDISKNLLLGAGGVLFTIWLRQTLTSEKKEVIDYGNHKP
jgi:hypothetical protein